MNWKIKSALGAAAVLLASTQAAAQITFYEGEGFRGRAFTTDRDVRNFARRDFSDQASSVIVERGRWEVCTDARFEGECVMLRRGSYDSLARLGLNNRISSVRRVERPRGDMYEPEPLASADYQWRRRANERVFEAQVTSVRAVVGPPEQRCWVEREQVSEGRNDVGGAIAGAIIGGILGHQVGGGRGRDAATAAGAIAGAAIGSNAGRDGVTYDRDVERCRNVARGRPEYWDVTYEFRGREHRVQMAQEPGRTILVNGLGEPRQ